MKLKTKDEFIKTVTPFLGNFPKHFLKLVELNKSEIIPDKDELLEKQFKPLTILQFKNIMMNEKNVVAIDTREFADFDFKHIPNTISLPLSVSFAYYAAIMIGEKKVIVIAPQGKEEETILRLSRTGVESVIGYLQGGIDVWDENFVSSALIKPVDLVPLI